MPKLSKKDKRATLSANQIRLRKERALLGIRELELAAKQGRMLDKDEVERVWTSLITGARNRLLLLADEIAPLVAIEPDVRECRAIIDREIRDALTALAGNPDYCEKE